jgi:hypothetical protein
MDSDLRRLIDGDFYFLLEARPLVWTKVLIVFSPTYDFEPFLSLDRVVLKVDRCESKRFDETGKIRGRIGKFHHAGASFS